MRSSVIACAVLALGASSAVTGGVAEAATAAPARDCAADGAISYICGLTSVEDMVKVPHGRWIIGSSMKLGKQAPDSQGLYLIDSQAKTGHRAVIRPGPAQGKAPYAGCTRPDFAAMVSHGLELRPGKDGHDTLYAINHGGRETMELFDLRETKGEPVLTWSGCVKLPANAWINSVAALPNGAFAVTKYSDLDKINLTPVLKGELTGTVYIWRPGAGFTEMKGARLSGNNGIVATPDGKYLFVDDYGRRRVMRYALDGSEPPKSAEVAFCPDNVRWAPDGSILVAGQDMSLAKPAQGPNPWGVARLDPRTMAVTPVLTEPGSKAFDNGTVALQVGKTLFIGTFRGDRVAYASVK
ncbi:MAG TPA: SMP-30/gluconolactonase/LRE family protein [Caulobacteraceae bacterium]